MLWNNPPNLLTVSRIIAVPLLVAVMYLEGPAARWAACGLFVVAAVTDYFDGYLARSWSMQTPLGRCLDPIADKLLVGAAILMLVAQQRAPLLPSLVILGREIAVSGLREFLAEVNKAGLPVTRLAKWKTTVQMTAIAVLLVGDAGPAGIYPYEVGALALWLAAGLTLVTGYDYLREGLRHMTAVPPAPGPRVPAANPTGRP